MDQQEKSFNPQDHLSRVGGSPYLTVAWRIVWARSLHPNAIITTDLKEHHGGAGDGVMTAVFMASVEIPGGGSATGWGSETSDDFKDYLEKAETKALGRALASLGFGAQFAAYEFGEEDQPAGGQQQRNDGNRPRVAPTPAQWDLIRKWREGVGIERDTMGAIIAAIIGRSDDYTKDEVSKVIYRIKNDPLDAILALAKPQSA